MRLVAIAMIGAALVAPPGAAAVQAPPDSLEARVWLDRGEDPVVQRGDEVRVYYRTSADAYVAIFRIDTDGVISLVFPQHPDADPFVGGGRDYRLMFPRSARWRVEEDPGAGYFFIVASPEPLDFSMLGYDVDRGWDLSEVGATVYEDPYVAIDDYVAAIVPDWEVVPYALDFLTYSVGTAKSYPRFLCYDCHGYRSYATWNPYVDDCSTYRVVIWDDPYFYPRYRYVGTRVVFARPLAPRPRYGVVRRVSGGPVAPLVETRAAPPRRTVEYKESPRRPSSRTRAPFPRGSTAPATARPVTPSRTPPSGVRSSSAAAAGGRASPTRGPTGVPPEARPLPTRAGTTPPEARARPTLRRRPDSPSARLPNPAPSGARGTTSRGTTTRGTPSRGPTSGGGAVRRPPRSGGATSTPPPARAVRGGSNRSGAPAARGGAPRPPPRAGPSRAPTAGSRGPAGGRPTARPPAARPPARPGTPRRRRGGRGG